MKTNLKIDILPNLYLKKDNTLDKDSLINMCGKIAGVCYAEDGFESVDNEPKEKTESRINNTLNNGHYSVYDHIFISFNIQNLPKILAMFLNNEHQYTTSERSLRYKEIKSTNDSLVTKLEEDLYNKWKDKFERILREKYPNLNNRKIKTLSLENARYLVSVFVETQMVYTTSFRQINNIASWMNRYIEENGDDYFNQNIKNYMKDFISELDRLNVLDERLLKNDKNKKLSLFKDQLDNSKEHFDYDYSCNYLGSFASLAEAQRSRGIDYQIGLIDNNYYDFAVPSIIEDDYDLFNYWLDDINKVKDNYPQGMLVNINERGNYKRFLEKAKERLCFHAQNEIMRQTRDIMNKYTSDLKKHNPDLYEYMKDYTKGARCTFKDYKCTSDCNFLDAKKLIRKI